MREGVHVLSAGMQRIARSGIGPAQLNRRTGVVLQVHARSHAIGPSDAVRSPFTPAIPASRPHSARCSRRSARARPMSMRRRGAIIDDVAARGDAALVEYTNRFDRVSLTAGNAAPRPGRDRRGRRRRSARHRGRAARRGRADREPFIAGSCRPTSTTSMTSGCGSGSAGGRSRRSASMCRAAPLPIRRRC